MNANKRPLANLGNIIGQSLEKKTNDIKYLKRTYDSPMKNLPKKKKNGKQVNENDENSFSYQNDPTRTIENKIKNINISTSRSTKKDVKRVKNRIVKSNFNEIKNYYQTPRTLPSDVIDHDKTQLNNIDSEPFYAYDIFQYFMQKEISTKCEKYMHRQKEISEKMRTVLVDWLVEVQQTFELNHETLYHAVKIMDHFLMYSTISRVRFQLLGIASIFIAAKLDERIYPIIDDFIYISDDAYSREDIIHMEIEILQVLEFNLNYPLSYSFLRRFARCSSQTLETLTLSRYILETSLMDYSFVDELDSKMAAAALFLALKMKNLSWNATLEFYSSYKEQDLYDLARQLNHLIKMETKYDTIRNKYSDSAFFGVASIMPLDNI